MALSAKQFLFESRHCEELSLAEQNESFNLSCSCSCFSDCACHAYFRGIAVNFFFSFLIADDYMIFPSSIFSLFPFQIRHGEDDFLGANNDTNYLAECLMVHDGQDIYVSEVAPVSRQQVVDNLAAGQY
jgi:hypothetical protein